VGIHTKQASGNAYAGNTLVAELPANQLRLVYMTENDWDLISAGGSETTPNGFAETVEVWRATHGDNAVVQIRTVPLWEQNQTLAATVAGGESPDIVQLTMYSYPLWPSRGLIQPLTNWADNLSLYNGDVFEQDIMEVYRWAGHFFGTVNKGSTEEYRFYTIYNQTLFDESGEITPFEHWQNDNWNWTQFVRTARAMTVGEESYGFTSWGLFPQFGPYPIARVNQDETVTLHIDDVRYIRYMTEISNLYSVENAARNDWSLQDWRALLPVNVDAMCFGSLGNMMNMVRQANRRGLGANLRIAPVPFMDFNDETLPIPFSYILANSITTAAPAPQGAAEFLRLLSYVGQNQKAAQMADGSHWTAGYFTGEEWEMMNWYNTLAPAYDVSVGIGNCFDIVEGILGESVRNPDGRSIQSIIDSVTPILQAEFDAFNAGVIRMGTRE
jgi:ABC-type glycerol-3-phosphate transport system substrate-binding protein